MAKNWKKVITAGAAALFSIYVAARAVVREQAGDTDIDDDNPYIKNDAFSRAGVENDSRIESSEVYKNVYEQCIKPALD